MVVVIITGFLAHLGDPYGALGDPWDLMEMDRAVPLVVFSSWEVSLSPHLTPRIMLKSP